MSDSLSTLLRGLAEALTPYLTTGADVNVDDAVDRAISDYDFADLVGDAVRDVDWSGEGVITYDNFDISDYDLMDTSDIDVAIDEAVDAKIEDALESVVTVDNILSVLQGALSNAAMNAERAA